MSSQLPEPGDVFSAQVADGQELLFRVLGAHGATRCLVATRESGPPRTKLPRTGAVREVQPHDHHQWNRPMVGGWVTGPAPSPFRWLGRLPLSPDEQAQVVHPEPYLKLPVREQRALQGALLPARGWLGVWEDAKAQWRWQHQRAQVLAEDAAREVQKVNTLQAALAAQGRARAAVETKGVGALRKRRFFAAWKGSLPAPMVKDAEALVQAALVKLEGKSPAQAVRSLVALVKRFNALDGCHGHAFDTADAEDIMEAIGTVALACRVDDDTFDDVIDAARDF